MASWLDIPEIELSVFIKRCLNQRIPDLETLRHEVTAWAQRRNAEQAGTDRQLTTEDVHTKLMRVLSAMLRRNDLCVPPSQI